MRHFLVLLALTWSSVGTAALAGEAVVRRGVDAFTTPGDGNSYLDFAQDPIPADFFCAGSRAFTGKVLLRGKPLVTSAPELHGIDTLVERLDDAAFDARGVAISRIRLAALSLRSLEPIRTPCGRFDVLVGLEGEQRQTLLRITRKNEGGGTYVAPLAVDARVTFVPRGKAGVEPPSIKMSLNFSAHRPAPWSFANGSNRRIQAPFAVDRDGDGVAETHVTGAANFLAGATSPLGSSAESCIEGINLYCHGSISDRHCYCAYY